MPKRRKILLYSNCDKGFACSASAASASESSAAFLSLPFRCVSPPRLSRLCLAAAFDCAVSDHFPIANEALVAVVDCSVETEKCSTHAYVAGVSPEPKGFPCPTGTQFPVPFDYGCEKTRNSL